MSEPDRWPHWSLALALSLVLAVGAVVNSRRGEWGTAAAAATTSVACAFISGFLYRERLRQLGKPSRFRYLRRRMEEE
jgi:hypothetical protein